MEEEKEQILFLDESDQNFLDIIPLYEFLLYENIPQIDDSTLCSIESKNEERQLIKSGRKRRRQLENGEKIHDRYSTDNILRRIQVHYMTFIINIVNELLNYLGYKYKFIDIDYNIKKAINKKQFYAIKKLNIAQIICQTSSPKFKNHSKQKNNNIYEKVKGDEKVNQFLSKTFMELFKDVYLKDKRYINEYGLIFPLSEKVKTYKDLFSKKKEKDEINEYTKKVDEVIQIYYLNMFKCKK
jgi:hypothetical protein